MTDPIVPRGITYRMAADDLMPGPAVGDVLLSSRSAYVVVSSRRVKLRSQASNPGVRKYALLVHRYPRTADGIPGTGLVYNLVWDSRAPRHGQRSSPVG